MIAAVVSSWVSEEILETVDHRQRVWTIPRVLRPTFGGTRLWYQAESGQIQYCTHKGLTRSMDALDWIALVTSQKSGASSARSFST